MVHSSEPGTHNAHEGLLREMVRYTGEKDLGQSEESQPYLGFLWNSLNFKNRCDFITPGLESSEVRQYWKLVGKLDSHLIRRARNEEHLFP